MKHEHMKRVKLVWQHGEEAICVNCGHHNAMLQTGSIGNVTFYECRDCHTIVAHHKTNIAQGDEEDYEDARIIGRSIGKTCYKCRSFVDIHDRKVDPADGKEKYGHWCGECGTFWGS